MNDYAYKLLITRHIWGFDHKKTYSNQTEATQSFFNSIYGLRPDLKLPFLLGENEQGKLEYTDLKKHHTLIGGATEGGKTTYIKGGLINLLHWSSPEYLKVGVIDLKRAGFRASENIVTFGDTHEKATEIIKKLHGIMEKRNLLLGDLGCENSCEANAIAYRTRNTKYMMPYIVFIFDEFADYLEKESKNKRDDSVLSMVHALASKGRAEGIRLIFSTQSPYKKYVSGAIKNNFVRRISFGVSDEVERIILGSKGGRDCLRPMHLDTGEFLLRKIARRIKYTALNCDNYSFKNACKNLERGGYYYGLKNLAH